MRLVGWGSGSPGRRSSRSGTCSRSSERSSATPWATRAGTGWTRQRRRPSARCCGRGCAHGTRWPPRGLPQCSPPSPHREPGVGLDAIGDKSMAIPEAGNGAPDLLDEARMGDGVAARRCRCREGKPLAGMAHHKMHDKSWTELGTAPDDDKTPRYVHPPSTAATLNLAATAAQASARVPRHRPRVQPALPGGRQRAWVAAHRASGSYCRDRQRSAAARTTTRTCSDELYWAAAELLATTGAADVRAVHRTLAAEAARADVDRRAAPACSTRRSPGSSVEAAGTISLALSTLPALAELRKQARAAVDRCGRRVAGAAGARGLSAADGAIADNAYAWGSNSLVLTTRSCSRCAYDFSGDARYRDAVVGALDYVLGRNALDQSYVTGYGSRPLQQPAPPLLRAPGAQRPAAAAAGHRLGRAEQRAAGSRRAERRPRRASRRNSASSITSSRGRPTRSPSTGTRRSPGWWRSSTMQPASDAGMPRP